MSGRNSRKTRSSRRAQSTPGRSSAYTKPQSVNAAALEQSLREDPTDVTAAFALAEHYYKTNQETRIIDVLRPLDADALRRDSGHRLRYLTLLALAYSFSGELIEAEKTIESGVSEFPDAIDFYYVLSYVKLSLREYQPAIEAGQKYLQLLSVEPPAHLPQPLCALMVHLSQLHNIIGSAHREAREFEKAAEHYRKAIKADPQNHLPYLNLATLHYHKNDIDKARSVIRKGLGACRQVQELRLLEQTVRNHRTVSACMIVKDEELLLPGCLDTVRHWVDEIIIVDTGSSDKTVEIAESYGARVFHQKWSGDFSRHRNYSLEQATCDWIFVIDADERICEEDIPHLKELINSDQHAIISINVYNVYGEDETRTTFLPSVRLFKRDLNLRYEGIVHNRLDFPADMALVRANVKLKHLGYDLSPEQMKKKFERSKGLLKRQLEKNPDDAFALFNYAQLLRGAGKDNPKLYGDEIIQCASRAVELTNPDELQTRNLHLMSLDQLAWAYFYKGELRKSLAVARRALGHKRDYLDPLLLLGHIFTQAKKFKAATKAYLAYVDAQTRYDPTQEKDNIILVNPDSRTAAYYGLAIICELTGKKRKALEYYKKTAEINPDHLDVQSHISRLQADDSCSSDSLASGAETFEETLRQGESLLDADRKEAAESTFQRALELKPDGAKQIAAAFFARNIYEKAIEYFKKAVELHPSEPEVLNDLGNCYFKMKRYSEAEKCYLRATEQDRVPALVYRNLGLTLTGIGKINEALTYFEKYLKQIPDDDEILKLTADLYADSEDFASALRLYEKALMNRPEDSGLMFNLSECYLHMGHTDSARMGYERVLQLDSGFEPALNRLHELLEPASKV